jgi:TetR/AcrR family transcriptional repressor of nem operon
MKVSREQAELNRERVLNTAAQLFRERGFSGLGVADLMKSAGLTHGAFYGQFDSKEDLMVQACQRGFEQTIAWMGGTGDRSPEPLRAVVSEYLSTAHRDAPGGGCVAAALGTEAAREGPDLQRVYTQGVSMLVDTISQFVPDGRKREKRLHAMAAFASMLGALLLSRAVDDEAMSKDFLRAVKNELLDA